MHNKITFLIGFVSLQIFISSTKLELKTYILLRIFLDRTTLLGIITLKISLSNVPQTILYPNVDNRVFACLLENLTNLSNTTLTWSRCISCYLWLCLARDKSSNGIDKNACIIAAGTKKACGLNMLVIRVLILMVFITRILLLEVLSQVLG